MEAEYLRDTLCGIHDKFGKGKIVKIKLRFHECTKDRLCGVAVSDRDKERFFRVTDVDFLREKVSEIAKNKEIVYCVFKENFVEQMLEQTYADFFAKNFSIDADETKNSNII